MHEIQSLFTSLPYLQICHSVIFGFVQLRDAALLFFDHCCQLLHQRGRFLLLLLELSECRLVTHKLLGHLVTNLFDLQADKGHRD